MRSCRGSSGTAVLLATVLAAAVPQQAGAQQPVELRWSGFLHFQYNTTNLDEHETGVQLPSSTFEVRRLRLAAELEVEDWITARLEPDFGGNRARLADAWVNLALLEPLQLRMGHFKKPFSLVELSSDTRFPVIERGVRLRGLNEAYLLRTPPPGLLGEVPVLGEEYAILSTLGYLGRDLGAAVHGRLGPVRYEAGVFNGTASEELDTNDDKSLAARLQWQPASALPFLLGAGVSHREATVGGLEVEGTAFEIDAQWGDFRRPGMFLLLEGTAGESLVPGAGRIMAAQGVVSYFRAIQHARVEGLEVVGRGSYGDPDRRVEDDEGWLLTPGVNVYFFGRNRLMLNYEVFLPAAEDLGTAHGLRSQAQLFF